MYEYMNLFLIGYIDKVRGDSMKIGAKVDASDVKKLYEKQVFLICRYI